MTPLTRERTCAVQGCRRESVGAAQTGRRGRGLNAYCEPHKTERAAELTSSRLRAAELRSIDIEGAGIYERRARGLAAIAHELDVALAAEAEATAHVDEQRRRYRNAIIVLAREQGVAT